MLKKFEMNNGMIVPSQKEQSEIMVFVSPDAAETTYLTTKFNLDEHTLHSSLDPDEISRLEFESDHFALIFKRPKNYSSKDQFLFKVSSLGIFMFKEYMIILIAEDVPLFEGKQTYKVFTLLDVLLKMLFGSITHYLQHLKVITLISNEIEQKVNSSMENKYLIDMFTIEKSLVYYLNAVNSNAMALEKLKLHAAKIGFTTENAEYLDDILIENNQCLKQTEIHSNILGSLMDARVSIVSNNLNVMMKNLNALVIAVAVPSFFAGMGGMSEFSMITKANPQNWWIAYPVFFLIMILAGVGTFFAIKWLERFWKY